MVSVGLVGCGAVVHVMYRHVLTGSSGYDVRFVHDPLETQAKSAARMFGAEAVTLEELAERADAILVTAPPTTHAGLVRACFRRGRILLCEKPFMTSALDAAAVSAEAEAAGAQLYVGHFRRVFPQVDLARELIGLGLIGDVAGFSASEGGRFTWRAVSHYTTESSAGGVLWDTGSHTLDMVMFATGMDMDPDLSLRDARIVRDQPEPSHDFMADFRVEGAGRDVLGHLHLSRREALPNYVRIVGTMGSVAFVVGPDDRVRLSTPKGSTVLIAERTHLNELVSLAEQMRRVLLSDGGEVFSAHRFVNQVGLLEALANG